jgi:AbrB family looped-hinge helix DNA binding protein
MTTVTISRRFQIAIPGFIREALGLQPGQKLQAIQYGDRIELIPVRPMHKARGMLAGIDTSVPREDVAKPRHPNI